MVVGVARGCGCGAGGTGGYARGLGHTSPTGRITLHPALLDPQSDDPWHIEEQSINTAQLGASFATDVLLHEMLHVTLFDTGIEGTKTVPHHNSQPWCDEIMRISPQLGLDPIKAAPVKPRRIRIGDESKVVRKALDGHLSRIEMATWPYLLRPEGYHTDKGRMYVPI